MYEVDGVDLSSTEFRLLAELVDGEREGRSARSIADERQHPCGEVFFDQSCGPTYQRLLSLGLIGGGSVMGGVIDVSLEERGKDVVDDWRELDSRRRAAERSERRFRVALALISAFSGLVGVVLGWWLNSISQGGGPPAPLQ